MDTHNIGSGVGLWQDPTGIGGREHEIGNDGNGLDLLGPGKLPIMADAYRGLWWSLARIDSPCGRGQDFTQRDLLAGDVLRLEFI